MRALADATAVPALGLAMLFLALTGGWPHCQAPTAELLRPCVLFNVTGLDCPEHAVV